MNIIKKYQQPGVTIIEILLVLAIGAAFIMLGIRQYRVVKLDSDVRQLQTNVNILFQGMANFYFANCNGTYSPSTGGTGQYGKLSPYNNLNHTYLVDIPTQLVTAGFITTNYPNILPNNALVRSGGTAPSGYVAQFNRVDEGRWDCTNGTNVKNGINDPACTDSAYAGTSTLWMAQVSVRLNANIPPAQYDTYKNLTGADCLSGLTGSVVAACPTAGGDSTPGDYLVWQRVPSRATTQNGPSTSPYWGNDPNLRQFNHLFYQYPSMVIYPNATIPASNKEDYFLCDG